MLRPRRLFALGLVCLAGGLVGWNREDTSKKLRLFWIPIELGEPLEEDASE